MNETAFNYGSETDQPENNYKAEGKEFIKNLRNSQSYCNQFFYDTEVTDKNGKKEKKACQIAPLRSKMIFEIKRDYNFDLKPEDFSTIVYTTLWAEGTWAPLDSFEGRSSFFAWLRKVAKNAVTERLEEEHLINIVRSRTVGNTRLTLLSQSSTTCKMVIDDMMIGSKYHRLLIAIYVDKLPKEKIMNRLNMDDEEYEKTIKKGEEKLKDALLRSAPCYVDDVLHDKSRRIVTVPMELVTNISEWCKTKTEANPLSDVFGINLSDEEVEMKTIEFLHDFSEKLWNKNDEETNARDCDIWLQRFINNEDPVALATKVGRGRKWLDTRYSQLNKQFDKAIKQWWISHGM